MTQDIKHTVDNAVKDSVTPAKKDRGLLEDCQLEVLYDETTPLTGIEKTLLFGLRLASAFNRRLDRLKRLSPSFRRRHAEETIERQNKLESSHLESTAANATDKEFAEGELVRVRSFDEIRALSDSLVIFEGMEKFCGNYYTVAKKVTTMFEPRLARMIRLKNTYLLDGVYCDGSRMYSHEGCNRYCYFFWKAAWLEKVSQEDIPVRATLNHNSPRKFLLNYFSYFRPGERVKVRSIGEINSKLDNLRRTQGIEFMHGMEKFCGKEFRIQTKMHFLLNEETDPMEMRRMKNGYILEGVTCDGQGITKPQNCDRACLYVWHREWLQKL